MKDASQLMDYGFPADAYLKLAPYLTALPDNSFEINLNTATDIMLKAYQLASAQIGNVRSTLSQDGSISKDNLGKLNLSAGAVTTASKAFAVHATVTLNGRTQRLTSIFWLGGMQKSTDSTTPAPADAAAQPPPDGNAQKSAEAPGQEQKGIITIARTWGI
jgi:type II secretory pathway component PulK